MIWLKDGENENVKCKTDNETIINCHERTQKNTKDI